MLWSYSMELSWWVARCFTCCVHVLAVLHQRYCLPVFTWFSRCRSLFSFRRFVSIFALLPLFSVGKGSSSLLWFPFVFAFLKKKKHVLMNIEVWNSALLSLTPLPCPVTARCLSLCVPPPLACTVAPLAAEEYWRACSCDTTHIQRCKSSAHAHCVATSKCWSFACSVITLFYAHMTINYCLLEVILIVITTYQLLLVVIATFDCSRGDYFSLPLFVYATLVLNLLKKNNFF